MTLVVAWKHLGAAFMAGDSALTHRGVASADRSSFDELQLLDDRVVEEMTPKILRLAPDVLAGFSGSVRRAEAFMNLTWRALGSGESLLKIVERLLPTFRGDVERFRVVFAFAEAGAPRLLHFSSADGVDTDPGDFCILGSAPEPLATEVRRRLESLSEVGPLSDDMVIAGALANLQALGVHDWLPAYRIGGAFFGAFLRPGMASSWQPPITYILHPPHAFDSATFTTFKTIGPSRSLSMIHTRIHHEAGIVFSSLLDNTLRILPSPWTAKRSGREWDDALAQLYPDRRVLIPDDNTSHFTFINTGKPRAVVLKRKAGSDFPIKIDDGNLLLTNVFVDEINRECGEEFDLRLIIQPDA